MLATFSCSLPSRPVLFVPFGEPSLPARSGVATAPPGQPHLRSDPSSYPFSRLFSLFFPLRYSPFLSPCLFSFRLLEHRVLSHNFQISDRPRIRFSYTRALPSSFPRRPCVYPSPCRRTQSFVRAAVPSRDGFLPTIL